MRYPDWQNRLVDTIRAAKMQPFLWGEHDCLLFAADCIKAVSGNDYATAVRGTYHTAAEARKTLLKHYGTMEKALGENLEEIPVKLAQRGDVAMVENQGRHCAGVIWNGGVYVPGINGLVLLKCRPLRAWRVN